jgi:hypothetical protein
MKIFTQDLIIICLGLILGTYETFIDNDHRISIELAGILSYILSLWICISYAKSFKREQ